MPEDPTEKLQRQVAWAIDTFLYETGRSGVKPLAEFPVTEEDRHARRMERKHAEFKAERCLRRLRRRAS